MKLSDESLVPLYQQVMLDIKRGIEDGRYSVGHKIPSESELSGIYSVSRITIRRAIEELSADGILTKKQGKGTYVNPPKLKKKVVQRGAMPSFTELCREAGRSSGARMVRCFREEADPELARALQLDEGAEVICLVRIRTVDDMPVILENAYFSAVEYGFIEGEDFDDASICGVLAKKDCLKPHHATETQISMVRADAPTAELLAVRADEPLFEEVSVIVDEQGRPVFVGKLLIVASEYSFHFC